MGLELELPFDQLPPVRTAVAAASAATTTTARTDDGDGAVDDGCATPTSAANVLRAPPVCPAPAPRKTRPPAKRKHAHYRCGRRRCTGPAVLHPAQARWIIAVPHDLAAVFVARRPASTGPSPCMAPAGKKIRVHVVS